MSKPPASANAKPYSQPFLNESRNSYSFLEEVTYKVNLRQLYIIKSTCFNHENMEYCPILVSISNEIQKYHNGAKFLLQVWSKKDNKKVYEKPLRSEVTKWSINFQYFMFKTEAPDEDSDCFHLVNLDNGNATVLVEDFLNDPEYKYFAYVDSVFYIGSPKNLKVATIMTDHDSGAVERLTLDPDTDVATISPDDMRIHGLLVKNDDDGMPMLLVPMETLDNQIDFNMLKLLQKPPSEDFEYEFVQFREVVPRNDRFDPVVKFIASFDKWDDLFAVALRESSKLDIYYNGSRVSSINDPSDTIYAVECTFDEIFIQIGKNDVRSIKTDLTTRMCLEESEQKKNIIFPNIFYQKIKNHCKIFNSFVFIKTYMLVAHGHIVSFFSVLKQKFIKHFEFDCQVEGIFRQLDDNEEFDVCVLLTDGRIKFINKRGNEDPDSEEYSLDTELELQCKGNLLTFDQDRDDNQWSFILSREENEEKDSGYNYILNILHQRQLYQFTDEKYPFLSSDTNFVFMFAPSEKTEILIQQNDNVSLYELVMGPEEPTVNFIWQMDNVPDLEQQIHSGIRFKDERYMFIVDNSNFYKIDLKTNETRTYEEQNCVGLYFSDNNYLYTLCHKSNPTGLKVRPSGFRLYDIENVIEKDQDLSYLLSSMQVGCQGLIDFSHSNQRLVFLSSYDNIEVVPVLHRNTVAFIGMEKRSNYLAARVIEDKFVTLDKKNHLRTWGVLTGKIRMEWNLSANKTGQDYSEYEIYKCNEDNSTYCREWYNKILIRSKEPISDYDENNFFNPELTKGFIKSQISYVKKAEKNFYEWKLIEIINEREVKEHFSYIHPFYEDRAVQNIFFSQDTEYMYEHLVNQRYFLYKKVQGQNNRVTWQQVHRFTGFPTDLISQCTFPYLFSKDFSMYLDVDRKNRKYMIRDSFTQEVRYQIPEWLMSNPNKEEAFVAVAHRFSWIDNDTVKIVNNEGIERLVDLKNNFREIEFNRIPMFDVSISNDNHYYADPPLCEPEFEDGKLTFDTLERLKRKYQQVKSAYYLESKRDPHALYQVLHTVDYKIQNTNERFVADLSFTFLHWNLMEQLESEEIEAYQIDNEQVQRLIYNILPGGNTFMHVLADKSEVIEEILDVCQPNAEDRSEIKYEVPFLVNFEGKSPMDILNDKKDYKGLDMMLQYLAGYDYDHHSRAMQTVLHVLVEHELPAFNPYLESRLLQTAVLAKVKKGCIRKTKSTGISVAPFWITPQEQNAILQPAPIEQEIRLEFVDMPNIHCYNQQAATFFEAIAKTQDMDLFNSKAIRKAIEYKWPLTREYTIKKLFIPFILFLSFYLVYMNYIFYMRETSDDWMLINYGFMVPLLFFSLYFVHNEITQLKHEGLEYLKSVWNYLDLIPPFLLMAFIPLAALGVFDNRGAPTLEACLQATMSLILWLKFLYFLRIFQSTGYLIRIIIEVCVDMRHFLLILVLTFVAFGDAMRSISTSNEDVPDESGNTSQFVGSYVESVTFTYRMVLGDFDTSNFGQVALPYVWILFILCTVFNMIIMLNLLVAIISESFARINEVSTQASYQEKAGMIAENDYLIPESRKRKFCPANKYLLIATDVEAEMKEKGDDLDYKLETIQSRITNHANAISTGLNTSIAEFRDSAKADLDKILQSVKDENQKMMEIIKEISAKLPPLNKEEE
eukprot:403349643